MFETDRIPKGWPDKLNQMDQVWVPTQFAAEIFVANGVDSERVVVVPEAVDVEAFSPDGIRPFVLPTAVRRKFVFLSVFKWEERKGWRFLLEAYFREFRADRDDVVLAILTSSFHSGSDFRDRIDDFTEDLEGLADDHRPCPVHLLPSGVSQAQLLRVYRLADAFVLPSRGEGWGRPHVEAMSMGLPIIATNWSGPTAFMTPKNSYPLRVEAFDAIETGPFRGHRWARPSVDHLRELMREVVSKPDSAKLKGLQAQRDMRQRFCPECVGSIVREKLAGVASIVESRHIDSKAEL